MPHLCSCRTFYSLRRGVEGSYKAEISVAVLYSRSLRPLRDAVPQNQDPVGVQTAGVGAARRVLPTQAVAQPCKRPLAGNPATTNKSRRVNVAGTSRGGTTALAAAANLTATAHTSCPAPLSSRSAGQPLLLDDYEAALAGSGLYALRECSGAECCCHAAMLREPD